MRILVVGSEGFIGGHCVAHFVRKGHMVAGVDLYEQPRQPYEYTKISRLSPELNDLFASKQFEVVINAAGSGNVPYSMQHPLIDFEANALDTIRILDQLRMHQPSCRYIHFSSAAVYGNPKSLPVKEEDVPHPLSAYGWHKLMAEHICKEYFEIYGLRLAVVRPFSVYGVGLKKQLFWDLFQKIKGQQGRIDLHGTGKESRDFIDVRDLVNAIEMIITKSELQGEVYNLASGEETTIREAIEIFLSLLKFNGAYAFNGNIRAGDPLNWQANIEKVTALGFKPNHTLASGLNDVAAWLNKQNA